MEKKDRFEIGVVAAKESGRFLKKSFGKISSYRNFAHDVKLPQDVASQGRIIRLIEQYFPKDGYLAEEEARQESTSGYTWVIDPLDGTVNYFRGIPQCCVSIACRRDETMVFGVVYDFMKEELFTGRLGRGSSLNGRRIRVSATASNQEAVISCGIMYGEEHLAPSLALLQKLGRKVKKVRILGAAALDLCYVACGRTDGFVELDLNEWDVAAGALIVEEAGGMFRRAKYGRFTKMTATNGKLKL